MGIAADRFALNTGREKPRNPGTTRKSREEPGRPAAI
jgi:hypothetical protein